MPYILVRTFLVRTDHQALKWLFTMKEPKSRIARWIESLSEFTFKIEHRSGVKHLNADAISCCPNPWECSCKNLESLICGPCNKCLRHTEMMEGMMPNVAHSDGNGIAHEESNDLVVVEGVEAEEMVSQDEVVGGGESVHVDALEPSQAR